MAEAQVLVGQEEVRPCAGWKAVIRVDCIEVNRLNCIEVNRLDWIEAKRGSWMAARSEGTTEAARKNSRAIGESRDDAQTHQGTT